MAKANRKPPKAKPLPGAMRPGLTLAVAEVPDPYAPGETIRVIRNFSESSILKIFGRGRLGEPEGDGRARLVAAERLAAIYLRMEGSVVQAIDYSRVKVDTSRSEPSIPQSKADAAAEMTEIRKALGWHFLILDYIVCQDIGFMDYCQRAYRRAASGEERLESYADLRQSLDLLITHWRPAVGRFQNSPVETPPHARARA